MFEEDHPADMVGLDQFPAALIQGLPVQADQDELAQLLGQAERLHLNLDQIGGGWRCCRTGRALRGLRGPAGRIRPAWLRGGGRSASAWLHALPVRALSLRMTLLLHGLIRRSMPWLGRRTGIIQGRDCHTSAVADAHPDAHKR